MKKFKYYGREVEVPDYATQMVSVGGTWGKQCRMTLSASGSVTVVTAVEWGISTTWITGRGACGHAEIFIN